MVFNISFIDHVIKMLGGRLFWNVLICAQGFLHPLLAVNCCCSWYITKLMVITTKSLYFVLHFSF